MLHILHCLLSRPDLTYIPLLIILSIIEYVTNKKNVRNPRSLMEGTETLCRDDIGDLPGSPEHL